MSLTAAMNTGVSGLRNYGEAMNVIGNNISNVGTVGFKTGRTLFSDMLSQSISEDSQIGKGVDLQTVQNIFSQGTTQSSENVTDLAIQGNSFFALKAPASPAPVATQDTAFLSRAGAFQTDKDYYLVNPDGLQVLDTSGNPIQFQNTGAAPTTDFGKVLGVSTSGLITYLAADGITQNYYNVSGGPGVPVTPANAATVQRIAVVNAVDPTALEKIGGSLFMASADAGVPNTAFSLAENTANGTSEQMFSHSLEQSNVDMASEFVKMIQTQRAYSANSKTITTTDQMTQETLSLIR